MRLPCAENAVRSSQNQMMHRCGLAALCIQAGRSYHDRGCRHRGGRDSPDRDLGAAARPASIHAGTDFAMSLLALDPLDLAALLCSRVCHDVISPVGAIVNGLEVLDDEEDEDMRAFALDLIKRSAKTASARLQFCRLAFGAAGSAGASIDTGDAENVVRGLIDDEKTKIIWNAPRLLMPKNKVKLVLNLCLIATATIPRGGTIDVSIQGDGGAGTQIILEAKGPNARLAHHVPALVAGQPENDNVDAHGIQAFYTGLIARAAGMDVTIEVQPEGVRIRAADA
jgi:histidine phosphotransferase ChpT